MDINKKGVANIGMTLGANIVPNTSLNEIKYTYPESNFADRWTATTSIVPSASQYTLSFWAKSTVNGDKVRAHWYSPNTTTKAESSQGSISNYGDGNMTFTLSTNWEKYWVVYTQSSTTTVKHLIFPRMGSVQDQPSMSGTGIVSIKGIKLEEGNHPTPWVPNSEDINYMGLCHGVEETNINKTKFYNGCIETNQIYEI